MTVTMTCMTRKQKFEVEQPFVTVLANGRYAFREKCPWEGKGGRELYAFKFCSKSDYEAQLARGLEEDALEENEEVAPETP